MRAFASSVRHRGVLGAAVAALLCPLGSQVLAKDYGVGFADPFTVNIGTGTLISPAALDYDRDGDADYAVAMYDLKSVALVTNNGDGTFTAADIVGLGDGNTGFPGYLTAADVDNDQDWDLVVVTQSFATTDPASANSVRVLKNNGGEFSFHSAQTVGRSPRIVRLADMNLDGFYDYVVPNQDDNTVTLAYNQGDGSPGSLSVGGSIRVLDSPGAPVDVALDRFDEDNLPDIAVAGFGGDGVYLHRQAAAGAFLPPVKTETDSPVGIVADDFDNDGKADLAVSNQFSDTVSLLHNTGGGTFETTEVRNVGFFPGQLRLAHLDWNGKLDVIVYNERDETLSLIRTYHKAQDGVYWTEVVTRDVGEIFGFVTTGDADGDGRLDLATATGTGELHIYRNATLTQEEIATSIAGVDPFVSGKVQADAERAISSVIDLLALMKRNNDALLDVADIVAP